MCSGAMGGGASTVKRPSDEQGLQLSVGDMPRNAGELTLKWLQDNLNGKIKGFTVEKLMAEARPGEMKEDGGGASGPSIERVHLEWKGAPKDQEDHPSSVILKITDNKTEPPLPIKTRALLALNNLYLVELNANEVMWYSVNHKQAVVNGYRMPKCYGAICSKLQVRRPSRATMVLMDARVKYRTILILQDFKDHKSFPIQADLDPRYVVQALKNIAALHGTFWNRFNPETNPEFKTMPGSGYSDCIWLRDIILGARTSGTMLNKPMLDFHTGSVLKKATKKWLSPDGRELFQRFCGGENPIESESVQTAAKNLEQVMSDHPEVRTCIFDVIEPQTICAGDCHGWSKYLA